MTVQLSDAQEQQLTALAATNGIAVNDLAGQAIDQFLQYRANLEAAVKEGRESIARGEVYEHADVVARIEKLLAS